MFHTIIHRTRRWRHYRQTLAELERLSDRELADIGMFRCDLPRIARESAKFVPR